jgi:hypothetical protein
MKNEDIVFSVLPFYKDEKDLILCTKPCDMKFR